MTALAFDTETGGLDWFEPSQRAFLVQWADEHDSYVEFLGAPDFDYGVEVGAVEQSFQYAVRQLKRGDRIWGHNLKFDLHHVRAKTGFDVLEWAEAHGIELWDTHSVDQVLHPEGQRKARGGHGLKDLDEAYGPGLAKQYEAKLEELAKELGISLKSTPQAYWLIYQAFPEEMETYARYDARATYDIGERVLLPQLRYSGIHIPRYGVERNEVLPEFNLWPEARQVVELERAVMPVIYLAERRGVAVDRDQVIDFKAKFEAQERELRERITAELGGHPASDSDFEDELILSGKGSSKSLREVLVKAGVPLTERTANGDLATNKNVLAPLAPDYPVIADLFEWRRVTRFLTTYIGPMVGRDVIHTDFQQQEAWTGRMSSRRPNMQNWPERAGNEVRNVLRARPGYKLAVADFSQMEAMIIVRYLNNPGLIESINDGLDMNAYTAALIWGGTPDDWRKGGPLAEGEKSRKTARHTLYATLYGAGACRVTQQLPFLDRGPYLECLDDACVTLRNRDNGEVVTTRPWKNTRWPQPGWQCAEARVLINTIKRSLPGYKALLDRLFTKIDKVGYVNTYYGRKNPISPDKKYVAVAGIVQGTGADILKLAAVKAREPLAELGGTIVMFVHDELVAEVPDEHAEEGLRRLVEAMENAAPDHNPHLRASGHLVTHYGED